jgi:AraC-like DNA-binding protein
MTAHITKSYLFTDIPLKWREIELDREGHSAENKVWTPFAKALQNTPLKYLNNLRLDHALTLRREGRLEALRAFLAKVWKNASTQDKFDDQNAILLANELTDQVQAAEQEWKKIDQDVLKVAGTVGFTGLLAAGPLIASGHGAFLASAAMVGGTIPLIVAGMNRRSFPDRFPAAFFMKIEDAVED